MGLEIVKNKQELVLYKGAEKFIFRYRVGQEDELLNVMIEQAKDKKTDFDWLDAAVLSFKLTASLTAEADQLSDKLSIVIRRLRNLPVAGTDQLLEEIL